MIGNDSLDLHVELMTMNAFDACHGTVAGLTLRDTDQP